MAIIYTNALVRDNEVFNARSIKSMFRSMMLGPQAVLVPGGFFYFYTGKMVTPTRLNR